MSMFCGPGGRARRARGASALQEQRWGPRSVRAPRDEASAAGGVLALTADNSLAWRPGASVWVDVNRRIAINFSAGYLLARPRVAFLERGEVVRRTVRADTFLFSTGIAYKLF